MNSNLSPIENLWSQLNSVIAEKLAANVLELQEIAMEKWKNPANEKCNNLIDC